jgi:predicted outer membrane repeat protein
MARSTYQQWFSRRHSSTRRAGRQQPASRQQYRRPLRLEPLEDRRMLAVVTVDTLADTVDFADGVTSLREAIFATNVVPGADTINFAESLTANGPATITLTQGELAITDDLEINGTILLQLNGIAFSLITIDASGNDPTPDVNNGDGSRVFNIDDGNSGDLLDVSISGLTLTGGDVGGFNVGGGAIRSLENLAIIECTVSGNSAYGLFTSGSYFAGGGIYNRGNLTVTASTISGNSASGDGGAIRTLYGNLLVTGSTLSGNSAGVDGGAISSSTGGAVTVTDSTISGNSARSGGGIWSRSILLVNGSAIIGNSAIANGGGISGSNVTMSNSTIIGNSASANGGGVEGSNVMVSNSLISGNSASGDGGGILFSTYSGTKSVIGSTISGNSAGHNGGGVFSRGGIVSNASVIGSTISGNLATNEGGGIFVSSGNAILSHTIMAGNTRGADEANDVSGSVQVAFSLLGVDTVATITDNGGNLIGTAATPIDPLLGPLADNGGPTKTHALLPGSPAINAGDLTAVAGVGGVSEFDQRGTPFGRVFNGRIDIGAFEYQAASDLNLVVDTLADESDGNYAVGDLSLREAILLANTYPSVDTIQFAPALTAGGPATILLTMGELSITDSTTMEGLGANLLTLRAFDPTPGTKNGDGGRILNIDNGNSATAIDVLISGLTLTGGDVGNSGNGGGIRNMETLTVTDSAITGNATSDPPFVSYGGGGGGIYNGGYLTVVRSTITDNSTPREGGAIRSTGAGSVVVVTDSTISGNTAGRDGLGSGEGGGIAVMFGGSLIVTGSTISDNSSDYRGGGIWLRNGATVTVTGTTISGNSTQRAGGGIASYLGNLTVVGSTISGNSTSQVSWGGGGIYSNQGSVTVTDSTISDNSAVPIVNSGITSGGGILSFVAILTVTRSTISGNSAQQGGGISQSGGSATITGSTISGNTAVVTNHPSGPLGGYGGGLFTSNGSMTVTGSTFSRNSGKFGGGISSGDRFTTNSILTIADSTIDNNTVVDGRGGGIFHRAFSGDLTITGSTISGNTTNEHGGGLYLSSYDTPGTFTIRHSTIAANTALGQFGGGGIFVHSGALVLDHTIVATNLSLTGYGRDLSGLLSASIDARYSLIGAKSGSGLAAAPVGSPDAKGNLIEVFLELAPLADNGGLTKTHALAASSPAWNAGDPSAVGGVGTVPQFDQRGGPYVRVFGGRIDIGAYERQSVQNPSLVVDTLVDETDGDYSAGDLSLREAIGLANGSVDSAETITFAAALTAGGAATIHLTHGELGISDSLTIVGPGANLLTIDASASDPTPNQNNGDGSRVLRIDDGNFETDKTVSIFGLTLTGGDGTYYGGGIYSKESLIIANSTIRDNSSSFGRGIYSLGRFVTITGSTIRDNVGGGIATNFSDLTVTDSAISGNSGAGISSSGGIVTVTRSTVSGNSAGQGGGIYATGTLTVTASTISGNSAQFGGGIMTRGLLSVTDSTISGNRATYGYGGGILSLGYGQTTITNSTISGNFANTYGGGIHFRNNLKVSQSTITGNRANTNGGGISNNSYGNAELNNTIVAGNTRGATTRSDVFGRATLTFSLLGVNTGATIADIGGNLIGTSGAPVNPLLGPLADNGGPTKTHALLAGSPAIDAGDPAAVAGVGGVPEFDQRGAPFSRVAGAAVDVGSLELPVFVPGLAGDYNSDGIVNAADYTVWRNNLGALIWLPNEIVSFGAVTQEDYDVWKAHYGDTAAAGAGGGAMLAAAQVESPSVPEAGDSARRVGRERDAVRLSDSVQQLPADSEAGYPAGVSGRVRQRAPIDSAVRQDRLLEAWAATRNLQYHRTLADFGELDSTELAEVSRVEPVAHDAHGERAGANPEALDWALAELGELRLALGE